MVEWNNRIMRKYCGSIRKKIAESYLPFYKGHKITDIYNNEIIYADKELEELMASMPEDNSREADR